jgi:ribosomal protein S12 methylthiotransferase
METQARISAARLAGRVGNETTVLVDQLAAAGRGRNARQLAIGRSTADAPEIDGVVRIEVAGALAPGAFARVTILGSDEHDLTARLAP